MITDIQLNPHSFLRHTIDHKQRQQAIADLLKQHEFTLLGYEEHSYVLTLSLDQYKLVMAFDMGGKSHQVKLPLMAFRRLVKDYHIVCESYVEAVSKHDTKKVEAIDMGRRGLHNEGAELLLSLTKETMAMDFETARKFFYLIYLLQVK